MRISDLNSMSTDELWAFHERITACLAARLTAEKDELERRLEQLKAKNSGKHRDSLVGRRPYPKVGPKFRNPDRPSETWAGRGNRPRWLSAQLKSGKLIDDFRIERAAA